jgi:hypothetical protein
MVNASYEERLSAVPRDMRDALAKFGQEAEEIVDAFLTTLEAILLRRSCITTQMTWA